ncbi:MAG: hypothetical protein J6A01_05655 [Proteobacteria bacterium]|nr:hypothetical protein [Pseudomonadota bacterium]
MAVFWIFCQYIDEPCSVIVVMTVFGWSDMGDNGGFGLILIAGFEGIG